MLAETLALGDLEPCLRDPSWLLQQKLDGDRVLVHVNDGMVEALSRDGEVRRNATPGRVLDTFRTLPGEWWLDGELLGDELWLFDLPQAASIVSPDFTCEFRLEVLERFFDQWSPNPCVRLLPTARTVEAKAALLRQVIASDAEGVVFRARSGLYRPGRRSRQMLKFKLTKTADAVVTAVGVDGKRNCHYSMWDGDQLVEVGSCSMLNRPAVSIGDVIELRYLYASEDRRLYQPVMLRTRDDKPGTECTIDQLQFTNRSVVEIPKEDVTAR